MDILEGKRAQYSVNRGLQLAKDFDNVLSEITY